MHNEKKTLKDVIGELQELAHDANQRAEKVGEEKLMYESVSFVANALGANRSREFMVGSKADYIATAKKLVAKYVKDAMILTDQNLDFEVYVVWFAKTLQNWKALLATTLPDGMYYEVTYNGDKRETYFDAYKKVENVVIPD